MNFIRPRSVTPLLPQGTAACRRKRPIRITAAIAPFSMFDDHLQPSTNYCATRPSHRVQRDKGCPSSGLFRHRQINLFHCTRLRVGGGTDSDARLCQSVAQTEVTVRKVNGTNQCVRILFLVNQEISLNFSILTFCEKIFFFKLLQY